MNSVHNEPPDKVKHKVINHWKEKSHIKQCQARPLYITQITITNTTQTKHEPLEKASFIARENES